jgi:hypothetical protein
VKSKTNKENLIIIPCLKRNTTGLGDFCAFFLGLSGKGNHKNSEKIMKKNLEAFVKKST